MNQSTWMVPLNLHHSFVLKTAADNSRHLQNISASIYNLSKSVSSIQHSAADIAGSANAIVELLESTDHRNSTMAAMRALILSHQQTCTTARDEEDAFTAYASCVISERLLNQSWFNMELFSHASFEEMAAANEMMKESMEAMGEVRSRLPPEESRIVETLPQIIDRIEELSEYISDREHRLFNIIEGHWVRFPVGGRVCVSPVAYDPESKKWGFTNGVSTVLLHGKPIKNEIGSTQSLRNYWRNNGTREFLSALTPAPISMFEEIRKFSQKWAFDKLSGKGLQIEGAHHIIEGVEKVQNELIQIKTDCDQAFSAMDELTRWANANFKEKLIIDQMDSDSDSKESRFWKLYAEEDMTNWAILEQLEAMKQSGHITDEKIDVFCDILWPDEDGKLRNFDAESFEPEYIREKLMLLMMKLKI